MPKIRPLSTHWGDVRLRRFLLHGVRPPVWPPDHSEACNPPNDIYGFGESFEANYEIFSEYVMALNDLY